MDKDTIRQNMGELVAELEKAGTVFKGKACRCPFHDDQHASAAVHQDAAGVWRFKCHVPTCGVSGDIFDIKARLNNTTPGAELAAVRPAAKPLTAPKVYATIDELAAACPGKREAVYQYTDPDTGKVDMVVVRTWTDGKTFRQARPQGSGYVFGAPSRSDKPWPLYNRGWVRAADTVVVVEGEKVCHALHDFGVIATTSPAGAGKAAYADWTPLAGKNVILWPDNDAPGRAHIADVRGILEGLDPAPRVSTIEPADLDLGEKEDAADLISQWRTVGIADEQIRASLAELLSTKPKCRGIADELGGLLERIIDGTYRAERLPWKTLHQSTQALAPENVCLVCGSPGASKSLMLLQAMAFWLDHDIPCAIYELEQSRAFHLARALAQRSHMADLTNLEWVNAHPDESRRAYNEHKDFVERIGRVITAAPSADPTYEQIGDWAEKEAKTGKRIIVIDPISVVAHQSNATYREDMMFLGRCKRIAEQYSCSIVVAVHPKKGSTGPGLDDLAGGAAFSRVVQVVLWIENHEEKTGHIKTECGTTGASWTRTVHILKSRSSWGQGSRLAFTFDKQSLTLAEQGLIVRRQKRSDEDSHDDETTVDNN